MRVKHWLMGCAICFAGIGGAAATSVDSRDLDGSLHGNSDAIVARDTGSSELGMGGGGEPPASRDNDTRGNDLRKGASGKGGMTRSGIDTMPPTRTRQPHLGWQSLLPGSIQ